MAFPVATVVNERILSWVNAEDGYDNYRKMVVALAEPIGELLDVLEEISTSFFLSSAVGDQLDKLGLMIGLPRSGFADAEYRRYLRIQIEIIASQLREVGGVDGNWTGTVNNILKIIELFTDDSTTIYQGVFPYSFKVQINLVLTQIEIEQLFQFIRRAIYAGVLGYTIFLLEGNNLWAYAEDIGGGVGEWDVGAVADEALWAYAVPLFHVWQVSELGDFSDQTAGFLSPGGLDFFPLSDQADVGAYCAYGASVPFESLTLNNSGGTEGLDGIVQWEYWDGVAWTLVPGIVDGTLSYGEVPSDGQVVSWTNPIVGWSKNTLNGVGPYYWIRSFVKVQYSNFPEYNDGQVKGSLEGVWSEGAVVGEGVFNTVFSTASDSILSNDNT